MKLVAFLLSFYFMLFSAQPVLAAVAKMSDCKMTCSEQTVPQKDPSKDAPEKCPICCCNIFQCAFCCGIIMDVPVFEIALSSTSTVFPNVDLILPSSYISDCWEPPELS
jgi:hypothetical protein